MAQVRQPVFPFRGKAGGLKVSTHVDWRTLLESVAEGAQSLERSQLSISDALAMESAAKVIRARLQVAAATEPIKEQP